MPAWLLFPVIVLNALSWILFIAVQKNIQHVTNSHVRILGKENKEMIKNKSLFILRIFYGIMLLVLTTLSLAIFYNYT